MKKYLSTLLLSLCLGMVTVQAASIGEVAVTADSTARKDRFRMLEKPFMLTLSAGANFNTGGRHNSEVFGCRPDAATQINFRFNFGFHRNWNVYADLGYTFYSIHSDPLSDKYADLLVKLIMPGISTIHPSFNRRITPLPGRPMAVHATHRSRMPSGQNQQAVKRVEWHKDYRQTGNSPLLHRRRIRSGLPHIKSMQRDL